jgi:ABC-type sugar transport system ATPase subunit
VRPEHLTIAAADQQVATDGWRAEIYTRQILGTDILYELTINGHALRAVTPTSQVFAIGDRVTVAFDWNEAFVFDAESGDALTT